MLLYDPYVFFASLKANTVKPPKRDHIGDQTFGPCGEVGPISEVFLQIYCMSL